MSNSKIRNKLAVISFLAILLDNNFSIFGYRFGLSAIIDLIPGFGDIIDVLLAGYIVWLAIQMEVPLLIIIRMTFNIVLSFLVGLIPVFGDVAYIFYRPNLKNLNILKKFDESIIEGVIVS